MDPIAYFKSEGLLRRQFSYLRNEESSSNFIEILFTIYDFFIIIILIEKSKINLHFLEPPL